jgi:hypothetical protein
MSAKAPLYVLRSRAMLTNDGRGLSGKTETA